MTTPKLKDSSSTALLALAVLFLTPGLIILSPDGRLFFLALAGLVSAVVAIAAPTGRKRAAAVIGLCVAAVMAIQAWPEFKSLDGARKAHITHTAEQGR